MHKLTPSVTGCLAAVGLVAVLAYANTLLGGFTYDDHYAVVCWAHAVVVWCGATAPLAFHSYNECACFCRLQMMMWQTVRLLSGHCFRVISGESCPAIVPTEPKVQLLNHLMFTGEATLRHRQATSRTGPSQYWYSGWHIKPGAWCQRQHQAYSSCCPSCHLTSANRAGPLVGMTRHAV